jgi:HK97 gp10 family phage protein
MRNKGIKNFQRRMNAIPKDVREAVKPALVKGADEIEQLAKRLAPRDQGDLIESIEAKGPGEGSNHELQSSVSSDDPNARWQEFGTQNQAAQPFFFPSYRSLRKRATNRIKRAISKAVKESKR